MPNRIIKESIRTSKSVNALSDFEFRLWLYLITYVDDFGRGSADPEIIKGFVFPKRKGVTESQIEKTLSALANTGMIVLYEVDGDSFFYFPNWASHQRIQTKVSKFPDPEENSISPSSTVSHGESPLESNTNPNTNPNPIRNTEDKRAFAPPTAEEVVAYAVSKGKDFDEHDAEMFIGYYESKGWKVGKEKMQSWHGALSGWIARDEKRRNPF